MTLPSARDILSAMADRRRREQEEKRALAESEQAERAALHAAFMEREVAADAMERVARLVRRAADRGGHEVEVLRFPSAWMLDRGGSLTSGYGDWTQQLDGFAARAHQYFREALAPLGYGISATIADYQDGMPGDVAVFLTWRPADPDA